MSLAVLALLALLAAIALSMTSRLNIGLLALAFAWLLGVYFGHLDPKVVLEGFPTSLFVTLAGVMLLFAITEANQTLERVAHGIIYFARGDSRVLPLFFFLIPCVVASVGPGSICAVAVVAPLAMRIGQQSGISPFLTSLMVANGAAAGNLSPISAVGIIANTKMAEAGLVGHEWRVFLANFIAHTAVALIAYAIMGFRRTRPEVDLVASLPANGTAFDAKQRTTLLVLAIWIVGVVVLQLHIGLSAFAAACLLIILRAADEPNAIRQMSWSVILMVCGVSTLIALVEKTGGMELFVSLLARFSSPETVNGFMAGVTGAISTYSSTSGVVLPAFLPTVPGLVEQLGGGDPLAISLSINIGSALVDVSPLSTLGALCLAAAPGLTATDTRKLFNQLLTWGFGMTLVGAAFCQFFAGPLSRM